MSIWIAVVLSLGAGAGGFQGVQRGRDCLAIGFGRWLPVEPEGLTPAWWRDPPALRMLPRPAASIRGAQWFLLGFAPRGDSISRGAPGRPPVRAAEFLWGWRAPRTDSLELMRVAAPGVAGVAVSGAWRADTLRGHAKAYAEAANAYVIRYNCRSPEAADAAARRVRDLVAAEP